MYPSKKDQLDFIEDKLEEVQRQQEILTDKELKLKELLFKKNGKRLTMTTTNSFSRQPTSLDYASPTQFKFQITKLPKVEYFCTAVNVPKTLAISEVQQPTPFVDIPLPYTTLNYSALNMTFLVDENLENFQEIHGWMRGLGFPESYTEYADGLASKCR